MHNEKSVLIPLKSGLVGLLLNKGKVKKISVISLNPLKVGSGWIIVFKNKKIKFVNLS